MMGVQPAPGDGSGGDDTHWEGVRHLLTPPTTMAQWELPDPPKYGLEFPRGPVRFCKDCADALGPWKNP